MIADFFNGNYSTSPDIGSKLIKNGSKWVNFDQKWVQFLSRMGQMVKKGKLLDHIGQILNE